MNPNEAYSRLRSDNPDVRAFYTLMAKTNWVTCSTEFIEDEPICYHALCLLERIIDELP